MTEISGYKPTEDEKAEARKIGVCPNCKKPMRELIPQNAPKQAELYCEGCHISIRVHE